MAGLLSLPFSKIVWYNSDKIFVIFPFEIDLESGETKLELHKMSTTIPFYGVPDLAEVLGKYINRSCPVVLKDL